MIRVFVYLVTVIQIGLAIRFFNRVWTTLGGQRIPVTNVALPAKSVSVVVPVLNEVNRVGYCLESLTEQGHEVAEILVVDGGSTDDTQKLVQRYAHQDPRIQLVTAEPLPNGWNGKAWGLNSGLEASATSSQWIVTVDADVEVSRKGVAAAVAFAVAKAIPFLSVAVSQRASTTGLSIIHPSLLSTLVYRFGIPGHVAETLDQVQSNGQFAVYQRTPVERCGGFVVARDSICEDVTVARHLFLSGYKVGFFEGDQIAETRMYADGTECFRNWPRSLSLRDQFDRQAGIRGVISAIFLQVLPLLGLFWVPGAVRSNSLYMITNRILLGTRLGVMFGTRRAYSDARWSYWLSPLFDPAALAAVFFNLMKRRHVWRGRELVSEER